MQFHWYGFVLGVAIVAAFALAEHTLQRLSTKPKYAFVKQINHHLLFFIVLAFGLVGARLYHLVHYLAFYTQNPFQIFKLWEGGLGIIGGLIGGIVGLLVFGFIKKFKTWQFLFYLDLATLVLPLGQMIGRWANFFNKELYGLPTSLPWGIYIDCENRVSGFENYTRFHPLFLYESIWCGLIFVILYFKAKKNNNNYGTGKIFGSYLMWYMAGRFVLEFWRINPWQWGILTVGQWWAVGIIFLVFLTRIHRYLSKHGKI